MASPRRQTVTLQRRQKTVTYVALAARGSTPAETLCPTSPAGRATRRSDSYSAPPSLIDALARWIEQAIAPKAEPESELALRDAA